MESSNVWTDATPSRENRIPFSHSRPSTSKRAGCYGAGEIGALVEAVHANGNATVVCVCGDRFVVPARFVRP